MSAEHLDEEAIFKAALKFESSAERTNYLKKACEGNAPLLARVEALLRLNDEAGSFLESPPGGLATTLNDAPVTEGPGTVIDNYKLLEKIGEGGMASVYMAEQKEPVRRKVALKIIKLGMDTKQVITRFEVERQALAMMDHPHIAKVHDAGKTKTGRPYFVMELVKGVPITEYCDKNELNTRQRLDLFMSVCQAIQHAHQKGIIHRDIKPSNVLVTLHDGKPVPKVIDFGIAKATNQELTQKTLFTRFAQMIGTPEYMSPEQAEMSGLDIDTRTDIYSLGVLLYELLIGITSLDEESLLRAGYNEIQRIIREEEPTKPSTRISALGEKLTIIAKHRHTSPENLRKQITGDLDWVVMKSLEKDRTRRYASATEFAADIQRHIDHEPVLAVAPSLTYKIGKFVRRNRSLVTTAAAVFIVLVAGIISSTTLAIWATHERDEADKQRLAAIQSRDEANQEREKAENAQIAAVEAQQAESQQRQLAEQRLRNNAALLEILLSKYIDSLAVMPFTYRGGKELEYLSLGIPDMIQQSISYLPGLRVSPFESVWTRYGKEPQDLRLVGGEYNVKAIVTGTIEAQGEDLNIQINILDTQKGYEIFTPSFPEKLADLTQIPTNIARGIADRIGVKFTEEEALRAFKVATDNPEAFMKYMMGRNYLRQRTAKGVTLATKLFKEATEIDPEFDKAWAGLADAYTCSYQYLGVPIGIVIQLARKTAEKALTIDDNLVEAHTAMAGVLGNEGKFEQRIKELERAIELNPNYTQAYHWLGMTYNVMNNLKKGIESVEKGLIYDPVNCNLKYLLGAYLMRSGQKEKGIEEIDSSIKLSEGSGVYSTAGGTEISKMGDHDRAIELAERGLALDPNTFITVENAAEIYLSAGKIDKALELCRQNIALYPNSYAVVDLVEVIRASAENSSEGDKKVIEEFESLIKKYPQSSGAFNQLGIAYRNAGLYDNANKQFQKVRELTPDKLIAHINLALTYKAMGDDGQAEEQLKLAIKRSAYTNQFFISQLRDFYLGQGESQKAVDLYLETIDADPDVNALYNQLGRLYRDIYEYDKAFEFLKDAIQRFPDDARIYHQYAITLSYIGKHQEAIEEYQKVLECIPYAWNPNNSMGYCYLLDRDYENAIKYFKRAEEFDPKDPTPVWHLSDIYLTKGLYQEAAESYQKTFSLRNLPNAEEIFDQAFAAGEYDKSTLQIYLRNIMEAADKTGNPFSPRTKARYYVFFKDNEQALEMLDAAFEAKDPQLAGDVWRLWFDELRSEPQFQELIKKLRLDKYFYK